MIINLELRKQSEKITQLIDIAERTFEEDDEMRSHIAKYVCILCSGFIENAVNFVYSNFIKNETTSHYIQSFISIQLNHILNPNSEKLRSLAKSFNKEWENALKLFLQEEERGEALNYIIRDRHKIAHGKDSDITLRRIREYHLKTLEIINYLENQCKIIAKVYS